LFLRDGRGFEFHAILAKPLIVGPFGIYKADLNEIVFGRTWTLGVEVWLNPAIGGGVGEMALNR
jgi:hypothetical protein